MSRFLTSRFMALPSPLRCGDVRLAQPAHLEGSARAPGVELLALLARLPGWAGHDGAVPVADVTLTQLGGAMSNHIFRLEARRCSGCAPAPRQPLTRYSCDPRRAAVRPRRRCFCGSTARPLRMRTPCLGETQR